MVNNYIPFRARLNGALFLLLALPWLMILVHIPWIFSGASAGLIDTNFYFGFFLDLLGHNKIFPPSYYGSRLGWILPGYSVFKIFSPLTADYVLHFSLYYTTIFAAYLILKQTISRRAALVGSTLMGCYCFYLYAMGWNYVDGAGILYLLLTTLGLTYAITRPNWRCWLAIGGAAYAGMIYSNLFLIVFALPLLVYYYFARSDDDRRSSLASSLFFLSGFVAISALIGLISKYLLGGAFFFWMPSLKFAGSFSRQPNPYLVPFAIWSPTALWLVLPAFASVSGCGFLFQIWKLKLTGERFQVLFQCVLLLSGLMFFTFQLIGLPVLQVYLYASYLIPFSFLAIGAQLSSLVDKLSLRSFVALLFGVVGILFLPYIFFLAESAPEQWLLHHLSRIGMCVLIGELVLLWSRLPRRAWAVFVLATVLVLSGVVNATSRSIFDWRDMGTAKNSLLAIVQGLRAIQQIGPGTNLLFWYNLDEPGGALYRSITSTYLWNYFLINENFPSLEKGPYSSHLPTLFLRIAIFSSKRNALQLADEALRKIGFRAELLTQNAFRQGPIAWNMLVIQARNDPVEDITLTNDGWPKEIRLQWQPEQGRRLTLQGKVPLFRSELDTSDGWYVGRYGRTGGFTISSECVAKNDNCALFSSGDIRDHMASRFVDRGPGQTLIFFSLWTKAVKDDQFPTVSIQDEKYSDLVQGRELLARPDGWVLIGNWTKLQAQKKLRLVIIQPAGVATLLDKALLVELPLSNPFKEKNSSAKSVGKGG
jgi:hypothetical protein